MSEIRTKDLNYQLLINKIIFSVLIAGILNCLFTRTLYSEEDPKELLKKTGKLFSEIAKESTPAVVFIKVEKKILTSDRWGQKPSLNDPYGLFNDEFLRRFFGYSQKPNQPDKNQRSSKPKERFRQSGQGSGFIISKEGYVLTNNHVVGDADRIKVVLSDEREFSAKVVGTDKQTDVAVLKIETKEDLPVIKLGSSEKLEVGEWVLAVGNPFGLSHTVTAGIVSAKGRSSVGITEYEDFIQTDAAINPGNSGGPLINIKGEVIGINTAIFSQSGGYMGIGFAIPVDMATKIYKQLISKGRIVRGFLGIAIQDLTKELAKSFNLKETKGILIAEVNDGTPASKAGLKQGDIILEMNNKDVGKVSDFRNLIALTSPKTVIKLKILRSGKKHDLTVKVGQQNESYGSAGLGSEILEKIGFFVTNLTSDLKKKYGYEDLEGIIVTDVNTNSNAYEAGIKSGVLIQAINHKPVKNVDEFIEILKQSKEKGSFLVLVKDGSFSRYVVIKF